jgi:hypothetical protein
MSQFLYLNIETGSLVQVTTVSGDDLFSEEAWVS